jgi:membrane fusion protein (multidrug efflux system)
VQQGLAGTFLYLVGPKGTATARNVTATSWDGGRWLIEDGLKDGDQVVVDGAQKLGEGRPMHATAYDPRSDSTLNVAGDTATNLRVTQ